MCLEVRTVLCAAREQASGEHFPTATCCVLKLLEQGSKEGSARLAGTCPGSPS